MIRMVDGINYYPLNRHLITFPAIHFVPSNNIIDCVAVMKGLVTAKEIIIRRIAAKTVKPRS